MSEFICPLCNNKKPENKEDHQKTPKHLKKVEVQKKRDTKYIINLNVMRVQKQMNISTASAKKRIKQILKEEPNILKEWLDKFEPKLY